MVTATSTRRTFADDVREIDEFFAALVARIDPDAVPLSEVTDLWTALDAVERRAASTKLLLARVVEEAGWWKRAGKRSAADQLAAIAGTSVSAAKNQLETSKRIRKLPATARALRAGRLSAAKAEAIAGAAEVAPGAEDKLLDGAEDAPLADVREKCMRARAKDREKAHARIRRNRSFRDFTDAEGAWNVTGRGTLDAGAAFRAAHRPIVDELFNKARAQGIDVMNVTHLGRSATVAQQVALWWRSAACTVLGCPRTQRLQNDHRLEWVKTKRTRVDELDPLCRHHHDLKTRDNWALVEGEGPRPMVPPDDPRHPNYKPPP